MDTTTPIERLVNKAKTDFILDEPKNTFLTSLLCSVPLIISDKIPTACVSPYSMLINETFFRGLSAPERKTLLAHEVLHLALKHVDPVRQGDREDKKWNSAGDHVINNMLLEQGFAEIDGWLCDSQFKKMATEEVYDLLPDEEQENSIGNDLSNGQGQDENNPKGGGNNSPANQPSMTPEQVKQTQNRLDQMIMRAATQSEMAGEKLAGMVPADVLRYIEELKNPTVPWEQLLVDFFLDKAKEDYSMSRPNKRYMPDFCMPSLESESMGKIVFICDASGSISHEQFVKFYSEASHVKDIMNPREFVIASFDTDIRSVHRFTKDEYLECPKLKGGGGTSIIPVLDFILKEKADVAVVFTDGYFWDHKKMHDPKYSNLDGVMFWLIDKNPKYSCHFGEIVHFKD